MSSVLPYAGYLKGYGPFPVLYDGKGMPLFAHWKFPRHLPPSMIVLHYTGGGTFDANAIYLTKPNSREVSIHFLVGRNGEIALLCPFTYIAYHAGKWSINRKAVGIECVGKGDSYTKAQMDALVLLCARLCELFSIPPGLIVGHRDIVPTICPRGMSVWSVRQRVIALLGIEGDSSISGAKARKRPSQPPLSASSRLLRLLDGRIRKGTASVLHVDT